MVCLTVVTRADVTIIQKRTLSAAAFEAATAPSAIVLATSEQALVCRRFLRLSFKIWLVFVDFVSVCAAIDRTLEHLHADCDEPVQNV